MKTVYLAGPIAGLTYAGATDWRHYAQNALWAPFGTTGIKALSPMRGKDYLAKRPGRLDADKTDYSAFGPLSTPRGIMCRDHYDATRCDVMLVNLLGAEKVSIGTVMEMAWAYERKTPVVCVIEDSGNPHDGHPMLLQTIDFRVNNLPEGVDVVKGILL